MDKHAMWKWMLLIGLTCWSLALVIPPKTKVKLGLDLKGGISFTVQINREELEKQIRDEFKDMSEAQIKDRIPGQVKRAQEQALEIIRNRVDALGVSEPLIYPEKDDRLVVQLPGLVEKDRDRAAKLIQSAAFLEFAMVHENNDKLASALFEKGLSPRGFKIASTDGGGSRQHEVYVRDPQAVSDAQMDLKFRQEQERFQAPPGFRFMLEEKMDNGRKTFIPYFVKQRYEMKGDTLKNSGVEYDQLGQPYVTLKFDSKGAKKFANITADHAPGGARNPNPEGRHYMAIIMDGRLYSAPFIKTAIYGGEAIIEGNFTLKDSQDLSIVLRAGSLPAPVQIIESRTVDPSLGQDSIDSGFRATLYSCIMIVVFMGGYYLWGGVIANIGLLFNMLLLPLGMMITGGIMGMFAGQAGGATSGGVQLPVLTLPGIAGIALTLGMAVDANVLIFERIREEQKLGKRLGAAVEGGYNKAFITIVDSNLTTIISAIILFIFGTGAVRGFGITLTAGIIVSMYTALIVTRMLFNILIKRDAMPQLKMLSFIQVTSIDFIKWRKAALLTSLVVIVGAWTVVGVKGFKDLSAILGTDFTGGSSVTFTFTQRQSVEAVRSALESAGVRDVQIQYQKVMDRSAEYLQVRGQSSSDLIKKAMATRFESAGFKVLSEEEVGPQIGKEMTVNAIKALVYALIAMIIYISWRFEFSFAVGGIVALAHDVLISAGLCCFFGRQISMNIIAVLLTIIGYSINDTIVIFDRIRENIKKYPGRDLIEICNLSINETLSRTLLTSFTVFMAVTLLLVFGGGAINDFAFVFFIGIIAGTYSTVYIATPVMLYLRRLLKKPEQAAGAMKR